MDTPSDLPSRKGFWHELATIIQHAGRVWRLVPTRPKAMLGGATGLITLTSMCYVAIPLLLGRLINDVQHGMERGLARSALGRLAAFDLALLAGAYLAREFLHVARRYLVDSTCLRIEKQMTVRVVSHLLTVDLGALTHQRLGALHGRIFRSVDGFVRFLRVSFLDFFPAILTGILALAATTAKQPWLGAVMAGVIPMALGLTLWQLVSQKGIRLSLMRSREGLDGTVVEQLGSLDYIRAANTHAREVERVARVAEERRAKETRHHFQMSLFGSGKALNEAFFHVLVLGGAIAFAIHGAIGFGEIWTFSLLFLNVMTPLSEIHRIIDETHESSLQVAQLLGLLAEPVDRSFRPGLVQEPRLEKGAPVIVTENLHVEYGAAEGERRRALRGISLSIRHGETIGVAGLSGCGKSTWLRVLLRLTHPCDGQVWLGGAPLACVTREAIGQLVGYVGQSPFVFAGTIADNITYGSDGVSTEDMIRAARRAFLHDEILAMPGGYQAAVAERGQNLSGGQRQRIALARVFLKNPPILILDEATSALDNISERHVQRAIEAAREDRTVILVAHRLSTLRQADRILVLEDGRIAEVGTYQELVERGGLFTELAQCAGEVQAVPGVRKAVAASAPGPSRLSA